MDRFMFDPDGTFSAALHNMTHNVYLEESEIYRETLLDGADDEHLRERVAALADILFGATERLAAANITSVADTLQSLFALPGAAVSNDKRIRYLFAVLDAKLAEAVVELAGKADDRFQKLLWMLCRTGLSGASARFLIRVSRCYLYGFDVECAIMCRSALDAEFQAEIAADDCVAKLPGRPKSDGVPLYDLCDRIAVAGTLGRLDSQEVALAHELRRATNHLVHRNPSPPADVSKVVQDTLQVISALATSRR